MICAADGAAWGNGSVAPKQLRNSRNICCRKLRNPAC